jgi:cytochrome P450
MRKLEPHIEEYASKLLDSMLQRDEFDILTDFADPLPTVIFCQLMGFPFSDYSEIMDWKNTIMHATDGHSSGHALARALGLEVDPSGELNPDLMLQVRAHTAGETYQYFA